jgi:hypothetical protein
LALAPYADLNGAYFQFRIPQLESIVPLSKPSKFQRFPLFFQNSTEKLDFLDENTSFLKHGCQKCFFWNEKTRFSLKNPSLSDFFDFIP